MATQHRICFERLTQEFDILFDYTLKEGSNIKLLDINNIQNIYGIRIYQKDHIIKNIIQ